MHRLHKLFLLMALAGVAMAAGAAAPPADSPTERQKHRSPANKKPMVTRKPIRMDEPMTTPMAKPGMMKEDMHEGMMRKDAEMHDMMEQESEKMDKAAPH